MGQDVSTYQLGDGLELMLEGMPNAMISSEVVASSALQMIKHAIPIAATITPGLIGSVQTAIYKVAGRQYEVKYALRATRVLKAAEIYSQAIFYIEYQRNSNRLDKQIANEAIAHLQSDFRQEFEHRRSIR